MEKKEFLVEVIQEIKHIKSVATPEEITKLDFSKFDHTHYSACIYGQMTGSCFSDRAYEIANKGYAHIDEYDWEDAHTPFIEQDFEKGTSYTALEKYLFSVKAPIHKQIIAFLKNETTILNLR